MKQERYKYFVVGVYCKDTSIYLKENYKDVSYTSTLKLWKTIKEKYISSGEWAIIGMKSVREDDSFKNRFISFVNGASEIDLPNDSIFSISESLDKVDNNIIVEKDIIEDINMTTTNNTSIHIGDDTTDILENDKYDEIISSQDNAVDSIIDNELFLDNLLSTHISEIDTNHLINGAAVYIKLLTEKLKYSCNLISLFTKERDCILHDLERIDTFDLSDSDEEELKLALASKIVESSCNRRKAKDNYSKCLTQIKNIKGVDLNHPSTIDALFTNQKKDVSFSDGSPNTKIHTYTYTTEDEKISLMNNLYLKHSQVIDFKDGIIKCYNKCYTNPEADIKSANVNDEGVLQLNYGQKIPKCKGTTIMISGVPPKIVNSSTFRSLLSKYTSSSFDEENKVLTLKNRIK